ncbi:hypothetical protein RHMOL_Rhmol09G0213400 [Rhododendron molle]|uniref:Uncharacterized protein n=1 Tax=Rhododendron molle TaxID=49168 RepID=A0ACC0MFK7_RHOML|nr:hypothetical protein RHMOL_Rhmol09G0213400 [Rhododendron molle]
MTYIPVMPPAGKQDAAFSDIFLGFFVYSNGVQWIGEKDLNSSICHTRKVPRIQNLWIKIV